MQPIPIPDLTFEVLERDGAQDRLLVLVHGYGEPPTNLTDRIEMIDPDGRFCTVVPSGPFEHRGATIWHRAINTAPELAATQFAASHTALDRLVGHCADRFDLPLDDAVVGGFSQGGGLAMSLLLGADVQHRPAAAFGVCSFPPAFPGFRVDRAAASARPYWLRTSRNDRFVDIDTARGAAAMVRSMLRLTYRESDDEHVMTDDDAAAIGRWLVGAVDNPVDDAAELDAAADRADFYDGLWEFVS